MATTNEVLTMGIITRENFPECNRCHIQQKDEYRPMLVAVGTEFVCGKCAIEMLTPKRCEKCLYFNKGDAKFCGQCGDKFE